MERLFDNPHISETERQICECLVTEAIKDGFSISVNDGEDTVVTESIIPSHIFAAMASTGEDILVFHKDGKKIGVLSLVWGNGADVMSDWTIKLDPYPFFCKACELADSLL